MKLIALMLGAVTSITLSGFVNAQTEATPLTQEQAIEFIKGKTLNSNRIAGGNPRLQFRDNGVMYGSNQGSNDSGKWKVEEGKLCMNWNRWDYQGCGQLVKVGEEVRHLNPDGNSIHLVFVK